MNLSFIAIGSNLENPKQQLLQALHRLNELGTVTRQSPFYHSTAVGPGKQPDYINAALALETPLTAIHLLNALQAIENDQGRVRKIRFGARTLDLDILLFNDDIINHPRLDVPHPRMLERNFVIMPLMDIAPDLVLPSKEPLKNYADKLTHEGLEKCN